MGIWQKIKNTLTNIMAGRNGFDQLSRTMIWGGLILYAAVLLSGMPILSLVSLALCFWGIFRVFSRNIQKRSAENHRYTAFVRRKKNKYAPGLHAFSEQEAI